MSIGHKASRVSHGRIPTFSLKKRGICPQKMPIRKTQVAQVVLEQMELVFHDDRENVMQAYIKNTAYYDKKQTSLDWENGKTPTWYNWKPTSREWISFYRFLFDWSLHRWKNLYRIISVWYAKLIGTKYRFLVEGNWHLSRLENAYSTEKLCHKIGIRDPELTIKYD